jgi:steroid delta-isomerase-like uncharacterized protein
MSTEENKRRFIEMYERVNKGDNDAINELLADDFVNWEGDMMIPGKEAFYGFQLMFAQAFPDFNYQLDEVLAEGDYVSVRATVSGTQKGDFMGAPASGKHAVWTGSAICRFNSEGKIVERRHVANIGGMLIQLGVIPPPAPPKAQSDWRERGERHDVRFKSGDLTLAGWLWIPEGQGEEPVPAVLMCNGFSAVKEMYLDKWAEKFADAGMAVLAFDYRTLGESEGEPRFQVHPWEQLDDIRNAITWLRTQPEIDGERIGAWGVSLGGGHVMFTAAFDKRVKAVVSVVPAINQFENFFGAMPREAFYGFYGMLEGWDENKYVTGNQQYIPLVAPPGQQGLMPEEAYHFYTDAKNSVAPNWENMLTTDSLQKFMQYDPAGPIHHVTPTPLCMIVAEQDVVIPIELSRAAFERAGEPKKWAGFDVSHVGFYQMEPYHSEAVAIATDWFKQYLQPTPVPAAAAAAS